MEIIRRNVGSFFLCLTGADTERLVAGWGVGGGT